MPLHRWTPLFALACLAPTVAGARERLMRRLDEQQGLAVVTISDLAQDARGFLWLGTPGGLERYDGVEIRPWLRAAIPSHVIRIRPAPDGSLYAVDLGGRLLHIAGERALPESGVADVQDLEVLPDGTLWVAAGGALRSRDPAGNWSLPIAAVAGARLVRKASASAVFAVGSGVLWRVEGGRAERLIALEGVADVVPASDGTLRVSTRGGAILAIDGGRATTLLSVPARAISLAFRGEVLWASFDQYLVALRPGAAPEIIAADRGIPSGGPLLVDREGSLWLGTFQGLIQFPEPESFIFTTRDGLPGGARSLAPSSEGLWVSTWAGLGRIEGKAGPAHAEGGLVVRAPICKDGQGRLWTSDERSFLERRDGRFVRFPFAAGEAGLPAGCSPAGDGGVWLGLTTALYHAIPDGAGPLRVPIAAGDQRLDAVHEDRRGRLWISRGELVCSAPARAPITAESWRCGAIAGAYEITGFADTEAGGLWAATEQAGVQRFDENSGRWQPIPGSLSLASRSMMALAPSPRGGTWICGHGVFVRALDRPDLAAGWEIVESPGSWAGLQERSAGSVLEEPDGALWVVESAGVRLVPAAVRDALPAVPRVELIDAVVDGHHQPAGQPIDLPAGPNRLELSFAALSYRDPALLRYRVRLAAGAAWSEPTRQPSFRFVDLQSGDYRAEVAASLDGRSWSPEPARLAFHVARPWYWQPWAVALFAAALAAAGFSVHRVRLAIRVRLERQRARIAMDLHDELGSALGSIGILAGLAAGEKLGEPERRGVAARIADTAEDLGESLGDIVWSLREGSATLDALAAHLIERAGRLFPEERPRLILAVPEPLPPIPLSLPVCSNVQRIALEALHNAARHAAARSVTLGIARAPGGGWQLVVEDDGVGIHPENRAAQGGGLGLSSMQKRADEIAAELSVGPRASGGTRVALRFAPGGEEASHRRAKDGAA